MPRKLRTGPLIFFLFSTAVFLLLLCSYRMVTQSLPVTRGRLFLAGLEAQVRVRRDGYGLPHVFAKNENDLFFAQGFVTAQDRLWQMDYQRHAAQGRLSEWFGTQASATDSLMRQSGIRSSAERQWSGMPNESRIILERYAAGVNAFIALNKSKLPFEYKMLSQSPGPWKPEDSISLFKWMGWQSDVRWLADPFLAELLLRTDPARMKSLLSPEEIRRILSSRPSPQGMAERNAFLRRVIRDEAVRPPVSGTLAWTVSPSRSAAGKPLLCVILRSTLTSPSPWYEISLSSDGYRSQGFSLPGFPMVFTGHNGREAWAWNPEKIGGFVSTGDRDAELDAAVWFHRLGAAENGNAFLEAARSFQERNVHFIYADTNGRSGGNRTLPAPGFTASGGTRSQIARLRTLMNRKDNLTLEDMKRMQSDEVSDAAASLAASVRSILAKDTSGNPFKKQLRESMFRWDGSMQPGSAEAAFFETFTLECLDRIFRDEMGDSLFASFKTLPSLHHEFLRKTFDDPISLWWDDVKTPGKTETAAGVLARCFDKSAEKLTALWGEDISQWSWAGLHTLSFRHPLRDVPLVGTLFSPGPFSVGGCAATLSSTDVDAASPYQTAAGASAKMVIDLSDWNNSVSVLPPGQSGQLMDPHLQDQVQLYLQNFYHTLLWDSLKVEEAGFDLLELSPEAARDRT